jgi:orotate phosphoribosyltransferase
MHEFAQFLIDEGVFLRGDFTLKSGKKSNFFLNFGNLYRGQQLQRLGEFFAQALSGLEATLLFGPAYKGIPLAVATAMASGLPYFSLRKELKSHGEVSPYLGATPTAEDKIVLLDDVLTTSATKLEALEQLRPLSLKAVVVGVDRQEAHPEGGTWAEHFQTSTGIPVISLIRLEDLKACI